MKTAIQMTSLLSAMASALTLGTVKLVDYSQCPDSADCLNCKYDAYYAYTEEMCNEQHPDMWQCVHEARQDWIDNSPSCYLDK